MSWEPKLTLAEQVRLRVAARALLGRGLLAFEDDPVRTAFRLGERGYRYLSHFWALTGVVEAKSVHLDDADEIEAARRRIAAEWVSAGAPAEWARREADAALAQLGVRFEAGAPPRRSVPRAVPAGSPRRGTRRGGRGR